MYCTERERLLQEYSDAAMAACVIRAEILRHLGNLGTLASGQRQNRSRRGAKGGFNRLLWSARSRAQCCGAPARPWRLRTQFASIPIRDTPAETRVSSSRPRRGELASIRGKLIHSDQRDVPVGSSTFLGPGATIFTCNLMAYNCETVGRQHITFQTGSCAWI